LGPALWAVDALTGDLLQFSCNSYTREGTNMKIGFFAWAALSAEEELAREFVEPATKL
jgi:hypothetical protein